MKALDFRDFRCGPREAEDSDFYTTLDQAIANKNIAPFETVRGWVFLTKPTVGEIRLKTFDATGESHTEPIMGKLSGGWLTQPGSDLPTNNSYPTLDGRSD